MTQWGGEKRGGGVQKERGVREIGVKQKIRATRQLLYDKKWGYEDGILWTSCYDYSRVQFYRESDISRLRFERNGTCFKYNYNNYALRISLPYIIYNSAYDTYEIYQISDFNENKLQSHKSITYST